MQMSIFLAKFFAVYFFIVSLAILFNTDSFRKRAIALVNNEGAMFLGAILTLILGTFWVLIHTIWVYDWRLLITLLVWVTFLKGILITFSPSVISKRVLNFSNRSCRISAIFYLLIGAYLGYHGFGF